MCIAAAPLIYTAAATAVGALAAKAMKPKSQNASQTVVVDATTPPKPTKVTPPPVSVNAQTPRQASRAPNVNALRAANAGVTSGRDASSASTLLTGPTGIDLTQLNIGRNTLLGS